MPSLIYISDPLCAWCYAQGPQLRTLLGGVPELTLEMMAGGLRPYKREAIEPAAREGLVSQLLHAKEKSGLPMHEGLLSGDRLVADSEPACRAVVAARHYAVPASLAVFDAIQRAYFVEGRDIANDDVLIDVAAAALQAAGTDVDRVEFRERWISQEILEATANEIQQVRRWGITGFPTLVLARGAALDLVSSGFMLTEELIEQIQAIVDRDEIGMHSENKKSAAC